MKTSLMALLVLASCASKDNNNVEAVAFQKPTQDPIQRLIGLTSEPDTTPVNGSDLTTAFILAEELTEEKNYPKASKLMALVFKHEPSLISGLKLSRLYAVGGDFDNAQLISNRLIVMYPKTPDPQLNSAFLLQLRGLKKQALQTLSFAHSKFPASEEVSARYVDFLQASGQKRKSKSILMEALKATPNSPYFLLRVAKIHVEDGKIALAKSLLQKLLRLDPDNIEALGLSGYIASDEKNDAEAERYFRAAYDKNPSNDTLTEMYAGQLIRSGNYIEARRLLLRLESAADNTTPLSSELTFQLGAVLMQLEDFEGAIARFRKIESQSKDPGRIAFFIAQCHELNKNISESKAMYTSIAATSAFFKQAQQRLIALAIERQEDADQAIAEYAKKQMTTEDDFRFLTSMESRRKKHAAAMLLAEEGLKKFPKAQSLSYLRASLLEQTQSKQASLTALHKHIKLFPTHSAALNHLGYAYAELGKNLDEAVTLLLTAVKLEPKNGFYLDSLGWAYFKQGNTLLAETTLLQALELESGEPVILEHLGDVKLKQNQLGNAVVFFERAKAIFSKQSTGKMALDDEWKLSSQRVDQKLKQLKSSALPDS